MPVVRGKMDATGKKVAIVVSRWNELVTKELLEGAVEVLEAHGVVDPIIVHVPGTWEIPVAVKALIDKVDGVVALGCILQGQTPHAKLLGGDVGGALMNQQVASGKPIAWGILTPDTQDQALDRAGLKYGNKGREAALATVEMMAVTTELQTL
jgi:6,7-dimethyl-8-ribityllumazine synthase